MADRHPPVSSKPRRALSPDEESSPVPAAAVTNAVPAHPTHALDSRAESTEPLSEPVQGEAAASPDHPDDLRPARPPRPPVVNEHAEVIETTRPGRVQWASERFWAFAVLLGLLGFITAWIGHRSAVDGILTQIPNGDADENGRRAAQILHYVALGVTGVGILLEAVLLAFLRRRGVATRVLLTLLAVASAACLPLALDILGQGNWLAVVVKVGLITHAVAAVVGSVLMWLPIGARKAP